MKGFKIVFLSTLLVGFLIFLACRVAAARSDSAILLSPSFQQLPMASQFAVDVIIKASEPLVGADVKINYDSRILEATSIDNGDAFEKVPLKATKGGVIYLTGLDYRGNKFSGTARLATLHFKAKDAGDTKLKVAYTQGSTTDSNLTTQKVSDVLSKVDGSTLMIGTPLQRSTGAVKRFILKVIPFLIFLILVGIAAFFAYRWWKSQKKGYREVFIPEHVPLDQPPTP